METLTNGLILPQIVACEHLGVQCLAEVYLGGALNVCIEQKLFRNITHEKIFNCHVNCDGFAIANIPPVSLWGSRQTSGQITGCDDTAVWRIILRTSAN